MTDIGKLLMLHVEEKISIDTLWIKTKPMKNLNESQREELAHRILEKFNSGATEQELIVTFQ